MPPSNPKAERWKCQSLLLRDSGCACWIWWGYLRSEFGLRISPKILMSCLHLSFDTWIGGLRFQLPGDLGRIKKQFKITRKSENPGSPGLVHKMGNLRNRGKTGGAGWRHTE